MARERGANGIKDLENGRYEIRVTHTDSSGKRRVFKRQADTITEARRIKRQYLKEFEETGDNALSGDRMTFEVLAKVYRERKLFAAEYVNGRKVAGVRSLEPALANLKALQNGFNRKRIKSITPSEVEEYKRHRLTTPTKNDLLRAEKLKQQVVCTRTIAAVNRELELLRAMLNFAKREGWILRSPFEFGANLISKVDETKRDTTLSYEEEKRLFEALNKPRRKHLLPFVITALDTGARRGELFKLQWKDVDFISKLIFIRATNTKTQTERIVAMTPRTEIALRELYDKAPDKQSGLVFGLTNTVKTGLKSALSDAGIEGFRLHDARHTAITRMVNVGIASAEIMKTSGHTQMVTFQRYVNPTAETARLNAERLGMHNEAQLAKLQQIEESSDLLN